MYSCCLCFVCLLGFSGSQDNLSNQAKNYEGSSDLVDLQCFSRGLFWLHLSTRTLSGMVIGTKTTKLLLGISSIPSLLHLPSPLLLIGGELSVSIQIKWSWLVRSTSKS
jgi:hypothetical protein